jgi:predicted nucleic acid-binding protein
MREVILDTNIFILFLIGKINPLKISNHRRTSTYTTKHYEFLLELLDKFDSILFCPNIATEVDNLLNENLVGEDRHKYLIFTKDIFSKSVEKYLETKNVVHDWHYDSIGITDTAIIKMAKNCDLLISGDSKLCDFAKAEGINVFDFKEYINSFL